MTQPSDIRQLADTFVNCILSASPFAGTNLGLREYDALMPDASREAEDQFAADCKEIGETAEALVPANDADEVTLGVIRSWCATRQLDVINRHAEYGVTAMPLAGPPVLFATLARTAIVDAQAAADFLSRLRGSATWLDQTTERLREGAARGRYPVGALVDQALAWADDTLATPVPSALRGPQPPQVGTAPTRGGLRLSRLLPRSRPRWGAGETSWPRCALMRATMPMSASARCPAEPRITSVASPCTRRCR